jgi:signal transduction histidine kinase
MQDQKEIAIYIALGCLGMFVLVIVIIVFTMKYQRRMYLKEKLIHRIESEKQISIFKASMEAEERQKETIARNLHDSIKPLLTYLKYSLSGHQSDILENQFAAESLDADKDTIDKIIAEISATCYDLIPSTLNHFGLIKSLEHILDAVKKANSIRSAIRTNQLTEEDVTFSKQEQVNIYRVCQELINNILKHAGCSEIVMDLKRVEDQLSIVITYNGTGITDADLDRLSQNGLGLNSLKSRVLILGASLNYGKTETHYDVKFQIPFSV